MGALHCLDGSTLADLVQKSKSLYRALKNKGGVRLFALRPLCNFGRFGYGFNRFLFLCNLSAHGCNRRDIHDSPR